MARTPLWTSIAETLRHEIAAGHYSAGDKLPTEASLSGRFGVNRHTVRHALKVLGDEGTVHARRGAGVFVTTTPTDYPIGRRVRFHQNLTAAGRIPAKQILHLDTRAADPREAENLSLPHGAQVHVYEGLSLSDGQPIALFRSIFPAERLPGMITAIQNKRSVTLAFAAEGVTDYTRASTRLTAKHATATQALHLRIAEGAPILRTVALNVDLNGVPVEYGHTWFAGDRVTLTIGEGELSQS